MPRGIIEPIDLSFEEAVDKVFKKKSDKDSFTENSSSDISERPRQPDRK